VRINWMKRPLEISLGSDQWEDLEKSQGRIKNFLPCKENRDISMETSTRPSFPLTRPD